MRSRLPVRFRSAFSLVELLVVLAIVAVLATLAIPGIVSMTRGYQLNAASDLLINQFGLARQAALSRGHLVQVRLYHLPDYNQAPTGSKTVYRAMQCFIEGDPASTGTPALEAVTRPIFFPAPVIISTVASPNVSPLLSASPTVAGSSDPSLPAFGNNYDYFSFHFRPDGSTDLTGVSNAITLVLETDPSATTGLPTNYRTIQIDPAVGTARRFAP